MKRLYLLWIKEVFSHRSFILSNIIMLISIIVFSFALILSNSMIEGTDKVLKDVVAGDFVLSVSPGESKKVEDELNSNEFKFYKFAPYPAVLKNNEAEIPLFVKKVESDYFTKLKMNSMNIKEGTEEGLLVSSLYKDIKEGALFLNGVKRANVVNVSPCFSTGYKNVDENIAYLIAPFSSSDEQYSYEVLVEPERKGDFYILLQTLILSGINLNYTSAEEMMTGFYSTLKSSMLSVYFVVFLFALLAGFYSLSISISLFNDNKRAFASLSILGVNNKTLSKISILSVLAIDLCFILLGFLLSILLSLVFPELLVLISSLFNLNLGFYFLSFDLAIPFASLSISYLMVLLLSLLISGIFFYLKSKKTLS